ncbi:MAG: ABC transporter ATP-binding protein [Negativicutes bacterium]|nr:ABC transporter ATP-binding protein [Negativicutes bacterium]MDR3591758.1 ABC transporter ATP-binding protein [Negativicutes bacterium]
MTQAIIVAQNLKKSYGELAALKGISFQIAPGECFGFLGRNGAGKSTAMRMIYGLTTVDSGQLTVLGEKISLTPPSVKRRLGVVPQDDNLDTELSVLDNLVVYAGFYGIARAEAVRRGWELLEFMGLSDKAAEEVEELSGGLKRRLVIARALVNKPEIVILDEPTTGLDPNARRLVWQKLRLLKSEGVTLVLTTHYMEEAAQLCDRVVIMDEGVIMAEGSPAELVERYVLPFVIEVHAVMEEPASLTAELAAMGAELLKTENDVMIFARDGKQVWDKLAGLGIPQHACLLRPSQLEDVYLKLVGRGVL